MRWEKEQRESPDKGKVQTEKEKKKGPPKKGNYHESLFRQCRSDGNLTTF